MLTADPGNICHYVFIDKRPKVKELIQHPFFNQVIIKDPSYDDLTSSRMFILRSIETPSHGISIADAQPGSGSILKEVNTKENISTNNNIYIPEPSAFGSKAVYSHHISEEEGRRQSDKPHKEAYFEQKMTSNGTPTAMERRLGLIESIYHNICKAMSATEALEHATLCKFFLAMVITTSGTKET